MGICRTLKAIVDRIEYQVGDALVGGMQFNRNEIIVQQEFARCITVALYVHVGAVLKVHGFADQVDASDESSQLPQ